MFTGIIESLGEIQEIKKDQSNIHYKIHSDLTHELQIDQSVAHDGVCLTVTSLDGDCYWVTAIDETLKKTNLKQWKPGHRINLERSMQMNARLDGHIVQGHVDLVGKVESVIEEGGSWLIEISHPETTGLLTVEKGSISVNGTSLTCFDSSPTGFTIAIIPYTWEHTNIHQVNSGDEVNLEFDIIGKYVSRLLQSQKG